MKLKEFWICKIKCGPMSIVHTLNKPPEKEYDEVIHVIDSSVHKEMLEALEMISASIDSYGDNLHEKLSGVQAVRDVIAKAKGLK